MYFCTGNQEKPAFQPNFMKKVADSRTLLGVDKTSELKDLKTAYRTLMKDWHPDKFIDDNEKKRLAEDKSKEIIEAYHFLVSINPETAAGNIEEYTLTTNTAIRDFEYKSQTLKLFFVDGIGYEYLDVPKNTYQKLVNSDSPARFARRHIYHSFVYRKISKAEEIVTAN